MLSTSPSSITLASTRLRRQPTAISKPISRVRSYTVRVIVLRMPIAPASAAIRLITRPNF
ncbi:hypothetical protein D3C83_140640 [compost metagenome]